jgi:hypothetical protein
MKLKTTLAVAVTTVSGQASNDYSRWGGEDDMYILANNEGDPLAMFRAPGGNA